MAPRVNYPKEPRKLGFLMTALAPAFRSVDHIAGLNLNYRKCCWVLYGNEERGSLRTWILENCEEFFEMQIVRHAIYVGTMIGPDGYLHRWTHQDLRDLCAEFY